jgi:imidazoleglycerol-phosphate dehydratase
MARQASVTRETGETAVKVELDLDGKGEWEVQTGLPFFDHMLQQLATHSLFDLKVSATGQDKHHKIEDVAIALGRALYQALGEKGGIARMGHAIVPMDESLAQVAVDLGGRGYAQIDAPVGDVDGIKGDLIAHFLESFAREGRFNLHAQVRGQNDHHKAEALFKALARALASATRVEERRQGRPPSTKGVID